MSLLTDNKGDANLFDLGNVDLREAVTSTAFFTASATSFSNFDVSIPVGGNNLINLSDQLASIGVPATSLTAVFSYAMAIVVALLALEVYDSARTYGRSNDFDVMGWLDSLPTGLTVLVALSVIPVIGEILALTAITSVYSGSLLLQFSIIVVHTATYWALNSNG